MIFEPIKFGNSNDVPNMTITSTPAATNSLDYIKNEWRSRQALWENTSGTITITGTLPDVRYMQYFVLAGSNLVGSAETKFQVYLNSVPQLTQDFATDFIPLAELIPLGVWRAGMDPYGELEPGRRPDIYAVWLDSVVQYDSFTLEIQNFGAGVDVLVRMLMMGTVLHLDYNFSHGNEISFVTDPELRKIRSGASIPAQAQQKIKEMVIDLDQMSESDRFKMQRMEVDLLGDPFLVSAYPNVGGDMEDNYNYLGRFANKLRFVHTHHDIHAVNSILIVEA